MLSLILGLVSMKVKGASKKNKFFIKYLKNRNYRVVIKTSDNKTGKRFIFTNGVVTTDKNLTNFDMAMVWKDAKIALKVMTSGKDEETFNAINRWDLKIEGDKNLLTWFGFGLKIAMNEINPAK